MLLRAADLLAGPWRQRVNAATMLGQGKTVREAEIDAAAELADFWRFNVYFAEQIAEQQPISTPGVPNRMEQRGLEGFVYAVTPFNFTAIGGNLPTAPALMGNTVVWKPSQTAILSNWLIFQILREAGLPDGVINFVPGDPAPITEVCFDHPEFAGVHFTGSSAVFRSLFREVGERIDRYRSYPRLVGETGGKDFVVMHASADPQAVASALVRGSFEYQGQKCSAASRAYIPDTLWPEVRERAHRAGRRDPPGRPDRSHDVHGRRHRRPRVRAPARRVRRSRGLDKRDHRLRRRLRRQRGLVRRADDHRDERPALRHDGARAVRARA